MSYSDEEDMGSSTKYYKIRSSKKFRIWKMRTLATAGASNYRKFLVNTEVIPTEDDIEALTLVYINQTVDAEARKDKLRLELAKKKRALSQEACKMMMNSVTGSVLSKLGRCGNDPKATFDAIAERYGHENDEDLTDLLSELEGLKLKKMSKNPDDYFIELKQLNKQTTKRAD